MELLSCFVRESSADLHNAAINIVAAAYFAFLLPQFPRGTYFDVLQKGEPES